jgi:hypothetical protein
LLYDPPPLSPAPAGNSRLMNRQKSSHGSPLAAAALLLIGVATSGCVHRPYIQQGNYLETSDVDQVTTGMTRSQVLRPRHANDFRPMPALGLSTPQAWARARSTVRLRCSSGRKGFARQADWPERIVVPRLACLRSRGPKRKWRSRSLPPMTRLTGSPSLRRRGLEPTAGARVTRARRVSGGPRADHDELTRSRPAPAEAFWSRQRPRRTRRS